jgi:acetoin utilization protein AcuB
MAAGGFRQLPVVDGASLVGIITDRDLRGQDGSLEFRLVDAAMTSGPLVVHPEESAETAAKLMMRHKIGALPVVQDGRVIGIISTTDLLGALLSVIEATKQIVAP